MGKKALEYQTLEKIFKRHYKNNKYFVFSVGVERNGARLRRNRRGRKNAGFIGTPKHTRVDIHGERKPMFYDYLLFVELQEKWIHLKVYKVNSSNSSYSRAISNLEELFKLLANKGKALKEAVDESIMLNDL